MVVRTGNLVPSRTMQRASLRPKLRHKGKEKVGSKAVLGLDWAIHSGFHMVYRADQTRNGTKQTAYRLAVQWFEVVCEQAQPACTPLEKFFPIARTAQAG